MECNRASEQNALSAHNVRVNTPGAAKLLASRQSKGETPEILGASLRLASITFLAGSFYGTVWLIASKARFNLWLMVLLSRQ